MKRELIVFLLGLEDDRGWRLMVSSTRKTTAADCTHSEASLIGGSGCRWLLHEGELPRPFRPAQWRMR
jgi:hypothetical protein